MTSRTLVQGAVAIDSGPRIETLVMTHKILRAIAETHVEPDAFVSRMTPAPGWRAYLQQEAKRAHKDAAPDPGDDAPAPAPTRAPSELYG